ncbi:TPA: type 4 pilus major pilin [Stenotrophomonas maltophilia]
MSTYRFIQQRLGRGFGLLEVLLALGVMSAMAATVWLVFGPTSVVADVKETQMDFSQTATAIDRSMGILGGYSGLTTSLVRADGLAADRLRKNGALTNTWGGSVSVASYTVKRGNDAFLMETPDVPKAACAKLVAAMAADPNVWDAQVNGESVYLGNQYDPATAAAACDTHGGDRMGFVYFSGLASGSSVAALPLELPPPPPSVTLVGPVENLSPVTGAPSVGDATPGTPVAPAPAPPPPSVPVAPPPPPGAVTPVAPQPSPPTSLPPVTPPPVAACVVPAPQTQNVACPAGQVGSVAQQRQGYCGEVGGTYEAWATVKWGPWTTTASTCTSCPGPETRTRACPTGQVGSITDRRTFTCSGTGAWGAWTVASNTCAQACVAPASTSVAITRSASNETRSAACPAGQTGAIAQTRTRTEKGTRTTSWTCPAATGSPKSTVTDTWSGTYTYGAWTTTSSTCKAAKAYEWKKVSHTGDVLTPSLPGVVVSCEYMGVTGACSAVPACTASLVGKTYVYNLIKPPAPPSYMMGVSKDTYQCAEK